MTDIEGMAWGSVILINSIVRRNIIRLQYDGHIFEVGDELFGAQLRSRQQRFAIVKGIINGDPVSNFHAPWYVISWRTMLSREQIYSGSIAFYTCKAMLGTLMDIYMH